MSVWLKLSSKKAMAADRAYTFQPAPGVLLGGLVPKGSSWVNKRRLRGDFQEETRRKRQRDAAMMEELRQRAPGGVLRCDRRLALEAEPQPPSPVPVPVAIPRPVRVEAVQISNPRLPYQRLFNPRCIAQYVGNEDSRNKARDWLRRWRLQAMQKRPSCIEDAMLLLWGPVGSGKSTWAQFIAAHEDFAVAHWTPGDTGSHETQKLDFWLRTQPTVNVEGKLMLVILDDVEELFRDCKAASKVKVKCPIIATAGAAVSANLRDRSSLAVPFHRIQDYDAKKVVRRIRPQADEDFVKYVLNQAGGDLRQLIIKASSNGAWCGVGSTDLYETGYGRAIMVLNSDKKLCNDEWDYKGSRSDLLIYHNFHRCCSDETFFVHYLGFLLSVVELDAIKAVNLVAFAARAWRNRRSGNRLDALPQEAVRASADFEEEEASTAQREASVENLDARQQDEMEVALEQQVGLRAFAARRHSRSAGHLAAAASAAGQGARDVATTPEGKTVKEEKQLHWVYRPPTFKPGLHFACELLRKREGGPFSAEKRRHDTREAMTVACLSESLRLGTDHVDDLLERFHGLVAS